MEPRYALFALGPDNHSTYPECWGQNSPSSGRYVASAETLAELIPHVDKLGHDNFSIVDRSDELIAGSREEFNSIPVVKSARRKKEQS